MNEETDAAEDESNWGEIRWIFIDFLALYKLQHLGIFSLSQLPTYIYVSLQ